MAPPHASKKLRVDVWVDIRGVNSPDLTGPDRTKNHGRPQFVCSCPCGSRWDRERGSVKIHRPHRVGTDNARFQQCKIRDLPYPSLPRGAARRRWVDVRVDVFRAELTGTDQQGPEKTASGGLSRALCSGVRPSRLTPGNVCLSLAQASIPVRAHGREGDAPEHRPRKAQGERDGRRTPDGLGGRRRP
jgi:hypothetical protein